MKKCNVLLSAVESDDINYVLIRDEANFHSCGKIISKTFRDLTKENPCDFHQDALKSENVIVWCDRTFLR
jgi:hypothetical protein